MSGKYIETAGGKITETYRYDYNMYAGGNIILNAGKSVVLHGEENGIVFGEPQDPPELKNEKEKYIQKAEWLNEKQRKTKGLAYAEFVYVSVTLLKSIKGKKLEVYFKEKTNDTLLKQINFVVNDEGLVQLCRVNFTMDDFVKCGNEIGQYVFEIFLDEEHYVNASELLKVFPVIYVPEVMKSMGWKYSFKSQEDWFRGEPIEFPWENQPKLNDFFMGWALNFERVKRNYDKHIYKWKSVTAIEELKKRIDEMASDGYAKIPSKLGERTSFGTFDTKIIDVIRQHKDAKPSTMVKENMPRFEKYYFQYEAYTEDLILGGLDDFYGSVASHSVRYIAKGILEKEQEKIVGTITDLGIYIKDGFDYVGDQMLGWWSFKDRKASKAVFDALDSDFIKITNESYREYRNDVGKGGDFYRYSNIYFYRPNYKFTYEKNK